MGQFVNRRVSKRALFKVTQDGLGGFLPCSHESKHSKNKVKGKKRK